MSTRKKQPQSWPVWFYTTHGLLVKRGLPADNKRLRGFFENGNSPLDAFEAISRAERRIQNETVTYDDGTVATGPAPLPRLSPKKQGEKFTDEIPSPT